MVPQQLCVSVGTFDFLVGLVEARQVELCVFVYQEGYASRGKDTYNVGSQASNDKSESGAQLAVVVYIPFVEPLEALFLEDLFDNVSHTFISRVGIVCLKTCSHNLVGISDTTSKHLADGAE
jgi:hypothetical protein